ncbi:hypothetical protein JR316_0011394 [Psilocybe cubensis]|uniref:LysM domain-containing protein n=2 Tax=Psilocybe cubensis TaxID=181762 RepID=A0A8H8CJB4_PSICU|nr:hypothetical protein JR316_0011394 [Psilocybe cubensis]KAH9475834.1 hypothetical protein JR316_0011394 [Psilocybe cubensis]
MFSQLFAIAALAIAAQSVAAADCTRSYTIQDGDYCDKISQAQNVSTYQLAVVNSDSVDTSCSNLKPGASLCLAQKPEEDCRTTYTVVLGDTCDSVAANNGLNTTILYLNNPQINEGCTNIYTGEVLCTSKTVQVAAIPAKGVSIAAPGSSTTLLTPSATKAAITPASAAPAAAATPADDGSCDDDDTPASNDDDCDDDSNDDDDDDLPFCDEI